MRLPLAVLLLLLLLAAPAGAQRLDYAAAAFDEPMQPPGPIAISATPPEEPEPTMFLDRLEYRLVDGADAYHWDFSTLQGGDTHRLYLAATGDGTFGGALDYFELQALYSRNLGGAFDLQAGVRADLRPSPRRYYLALGAQGELPGGLYMGAFSYLSHKGELTGRLFGLYDADLPGDFVLQPSFESEIAAQDVPELGIGRGLIYAEAALRLRYEFAPEFAPYIGVTWEELLGRTRRMAREADEGTGGAGLILGLRSWF